MNSQQIEYVLAVAEERSFSKAAQKLFVTQPSLSQVIAKLENQFGTQFFDRSTNPVQITQAGSIFLKHAKEICSHENMIKSEINELSELKNGTLNIGTTPFRASCLLAPSITSFHRKHNNIRIKIIEDNPDNLKNLLMDGSIDIAITKGRFNSNLFCTEKIMTDKLYIAVSENNPINRGMSDFRLSADDIKTNRVEKLSKKKVDVSFFRDENFLMIKNDNAVDEIIAEFIEHFGFKPNIAMCANHIETLFAFVLSGMGIAFIPEMFIRFANIQYHAVYYQIGSLCSDVYVVSKRGRQISKATDEYKNILKQFINLSNLFYI